MTSPNPAEPGTSGPGAFPPRAGDVWSYTGPFGGFEGNWTFTGERDGDSLSGQGAGYRARHADGRMDTWYAAQFGNGTLTFVRPGTSEAAPVEPLAKCPYSCSERGCLMTCGMPTDPTHPFRDCLCSYHWRREPRAAHPIQRDEVRERPFEAIYDNDDDHWIISRDEGEGNWMAVAPRDLRALQVVIGNIAWTAADPARLVGHAYLAECERKGLERAMFAVDTVRFLVDFHANHAAALSACRSAALGEARAILRRAHGSAVDTAKGVGRTGNREHAAQYWAVAGCIRDCEDRIARLSESGGTKP